MTLRDLIKLSFTYSNTLPPQKPLRSEVSADLEGTVCDFRSFLEHEKQVLLHNIERQNKALEWYKDGDLLAQGHNKLIAVQKRHIAMLDTLLDGKVSIDGTLATCEEALKMAEEKHRQLIRQNEENAEMWWETSDVIQFLASLVYRIEDWKAHNQPAI